MHIHRVVLRTYDVRPVDRLLGRALDKRGASQCDADPCDFDQVAELLQEVAPAG